MMAAAAAAAAAAGAAVAGAETLAASSDPWLLASDCASGEAAPWAVGAAASVLLPAAAAAGPAAEAGSTGPAGFFKNIATLDWVLAAARGLKKSAIGFLVDILVMLLLATVEFGELGRAILAAGAASLSLAEDSASNSAVVLVLVASRSRFVPFDDDDIVVIAMGKCGARNLCCKPDKLVMQMPTAEVVAHRKRKTY